MNWNKAALSQHGWLYFLNIVGRHKVVWYFKLREGKLITNLRSNLLFMDYLSCRIKLGVLYFFSNLTNITKDVALFLLMPCGSIYLYFWCF